MAKRSDTAKQVRRRSGSQPKTGKGTTISDINRMREDWIDDPDFQGTPGPYNPRKKVYRKKRRNVQSPNPFGIKGAALKRYKRKTPKRPRTSAAADAQPIAAPRVVHTRQPYQEKRPVETQKLPAISSSHVGVGHGERETPVRTPRKVRPGPSRKPSWRPQDLDAIARIIDEARQKEDDASLEARLRSEARRRERLAGNRKGGTIKRKYGGKPKKHRGCGKALRGFGAVSKG
jgi:hypothetical protein